MGISTRLYPTEEANALFDGYHMVFVLRAKSGGPGRPLFYAAMDDAGFIRKFTAEEAKLAARDLSKEPDVVRASAVFVHGRILADYEGAAVTAGAIHKRP